MSSQPAPRDNTMAIMRMEQQAAERARAEEARKEAEAKARFEAAIGAAYNNALGDAQSYFSGRGLDPDEYIGAITSGANRIKSTVPYLDAAPGSYFSNLGATVFNQEQDNYRAKQMRALNTVAPEGFSSRRITNDVDDPFLESILQERLAGADEYIRNLLDRGVITNTGYGSARANLEQQQYGARARLNEIGLGELEAGRGGANNIANEARRRASNLDLGAAFDPYETGTELDNFFANFFQNLGGNIRAKAPTNLFSTTGLANIAGAAQGAQNTAFNPQAVAGVFGEEDDEEDDERTTGLTAF